MSPLEGLLRYTALRHKAIANNIANVETPGYRAREVKTPSFGELLEGATFRIVESPGKVNLEEEMGKLVKNGTLHNLAASLLAQQFHVLREAVQERVIA